MHLIDDEITRDAYAILALHAAGDLEGITHLLAPYDPKTGTRPIGYLLHAFLEIHTTREICDITGVSDPRELTREEVTEIREGLADYWREFAVRVETDS